MYGYAAEHGVYAHGICNALRFMPTCCNIRTLLHTLNRRESKKGLGLLPKTLLANRHELRHTVKEAKPEAAQHSGAVDEDLVLFWQAPIQSSCLLAVKAWLD